METNANKYSVAPCDPKTLNRWMAFRCTPKQDGSVAKEPCSVRDGYICADISNPDSWASYAEAVAAIENPPDQCQYELGFVLDPTISLVCYDIDKARATDEPWPQWVHDEVARYRTFSEDSVSGCGKHIWLWGAINLGKDVEKHDGCELFVRKMVAVSPEFADHWREIRVAEAGELEELRRRIVSGEVRHAIRADKSTGLTLAQLEAGESPKGDRSAGDLAYLKELIRLGLTDDEIDARFRVSPRMREKWEREDYRARTFTQARQEISQEETKHKDEAPKVLAFAYPAAPYSAWDFAIDPPANGRKVEGWFPLGDVSMIGGSSGSGKTTVMLDLLVKQHRGENIFGHTTRRRPYLVIMADRGRRDNQRTLESMGLEDAHVPIAFLPRCKGFEAAQIIVREMEKWKPMPQVVFIEGMDFLTGDSKDEEKVEAFLNPLRAAADHYNVAFIGSVGSPKLKAKDGYTAKRDQLFGSQAWGRLTATIALMQYPDGDDMSDKRVLSVLVRRGKPESFNLEWVNGRLVPYIAPVKLDRVGVWCRDQEGWFTPAEAIKHFDGTLGKSAVRNHLNALLESGKLVERAAKGTRGAELRWAEVELDSKVDSDESPLRVQSPPETAENRL